jgi:aspartate dehydrogenase
VVIEAASHDAVREFVRPLLKQGIPVIILSGGALCDDALRAQLEASAAKHRALLYVPSGGIGGLDALKAVCVAGADSVEIAVTKPPAAWKGIAYVENLKVDLDRLDGPLTLFDGTAREGVPHFPANVNIAAALSMAGIGFDKTRLKVVADPALVCNTHYINIHGKTGKISIKFESLAFPENPKTSYLACYSALAAFRQYNSLVRYGT